MESKIFTERSVDEFFKIRSLDKYMIGHKGFIAGGVFKNLLNNQPYKDVDVFFEKLEHFEEALKKFKSNKNLLKIYSNSSVVGFQSKINKVKIDLVRSNFGTPETIISSFDFTITKFAYFKKETEDGFEYKCLIHENFFEHLHMKKLVLDDKIPFPVGTFERSYRYNKYGFGLCRMSKANLINALQGQDTSNLSKDLYFGWD